jgi:flagellar capping protein FliD
MFAGVGMLVEASGNTVSVAVEGIPLSLEGSREEAYALADLLLFMATARRG